MAEQASQRVARKGPLAAVRHAGKGHAHAFQHKAGHGDGQKQPQGGPVVPRGIGCGQLFLALFDEGNITPKRVVECGSYPVLFSSIAAGKGVSLVLRCSISGEVKSKIKIHQLSGQFNDFKIELLSRTDCAYLDSAKFTDMVASVFQDPRLRDVGY